jgi:signal peptidase I
MLIWSKRRFLTVLVAAVGLSLVPAYLQAFSISGGSEIPTILLHDTLIVNRAAYALNLPYSSLRLVRTGSPARGDMVLLRFPIREFVGFKRVMGLPGETIEIRESRVIVNGHAIPVNALRRADFTWVPDPAALGSAVEGEEGHYITYTPGKSEYRDHAPVKLAAGEYYLLGDNRDDSWDSRAFGAVSFDRMLGKVIVTLRTGPRRDITR